MLLTKNMIANDFLTDGIDYNSFDIVSRVMKQKDN